MRAVWCWCKEIKVKSQIDDKSLPLDSNPVRNLEKGLHLHQQGRLDQAQEIYRQVLQYQPQNSDALHLLGVVAMQKGDNPSAVESINRAIQIQPHHPIYLNNLGNALRQQGRYLDAVGCYQQAIARKPDLSLT